jgi:uncharacterized protein
MNRTFLNLSRTLHIYVTLAALLLLLFFSVSGFIVNHDDWFGVSARSEREAQGKIDPAVLAKADRLDIVERLRKDHGIRLNVNSYEPEDQSIRVVFKGPSRMVEADIDRSSGDVKLRFETRGLAGLVGDLHKGSNTGKIWSLIIDISAAVMTLGSITGLVLWMSLPGRRKVGLAALIAGVALSLAAMLACL